MSTSQNRLTPTPVRQDAICMCAHGQACSSFAPGHAVHLIQARLVSATPGEWVDAIVTATDAAGTALVHTLDGAPVELWNGAWAAAQPTAELAAGAPVAYHPRYHVLSVGGRLFNTLAL
ncbi:hypothetical protein [Microbacterium sp.]|uniref:hypothetical protein n=1 Tax=Microbacterium sp. TaxID=51671 RepID=UPI0039E3EAF0